MAYLIALLSTYSVTAKEPTGIGEHVRAGSLSHTPARHMSLSNHVLSLMPAPVTMLTILLGARLDTIPIPGLDGLLEG